MKKEGKKWMLVAIALLAMVTVALPLVGCKNDSVSEQTGGNAEQPATPGTGGGNQGSGDPEQPVTYTVTFDANNGTGTMNPQTFTAGVEQELAANTFERKNYTFVGWSEDSKATSATFGDKAKFTATKDTTLYAVWEPRWLTFTSDSDTHLRVTYNGSIDVPTGMEYSTDGKEWNAFTNPQSEISFGNGKDGKYVLYLRGKSPTGTATSTINYVNFKFTENTKVHASGDIRTLVDWNDPVNAVTSNARFTKLFIDCDELVTAPKLPAETLATDCYYSMFEGCTSLETAPELPAMTLDNHCYRYMFYGCTGLKTAPELPATKLASFCYYSMFERCTSLKTAPTELPAETLAGSCYRYMFDGCTNLASVTMLATDVSAENALLGWLDDTAGGTLTVASGMKEDETIIESLPENWTVEVKTN